MRDSKKTPIFVTQPSLPPLEDFIPLLEQIWESKILTNGGMFHQKLEEELCSYLGIKHISLFANGTIALITALKALDITGEVITTPYSFVATSHSLMWSGIKPVFVDIDSTNMNLDPKKIEAAITQFTTAILPVHCYGNPCSVDSIQLIADKYNLKVIYDAAHAFGVRYHDRSLLDFGDLSVLSFHATKVFNTFEGGAIVSPDAYTKSYIDRLKNFGFAGETNVSNIGINGKLNEMQAALGLLQLRHIDGALERRAKIDNIYRKYISKITGLRCLAIEDYQAHNYSYFPVFVDDEYPLSRDALYEKLKTNGINSRRYFYPLISEFPNYVGLSSALPECLPIAKRAASQVLCLPIYPDLSDDTVQKICNLIS